MPQLDLALFPTQILWLVISFVVLYGLMSKWVIPRVSSVVEHRQNLIQGNLDSAEEMKKAAADTLAAYEKAIADAKAEAHALLTQSSATMAKESAEREAEFNRKLAAASEAAESRIQTSKGQAITELHSLAGEIAALMATKLTGASIDSMKAKQAADQAMREKA